MCFTDLVEPCLVQEVVSVINGQGEITCRQSYTCKSLKSPGWFVHTTCTATYHCVNVSPCLFLPSNTPWDRWLVSGISGKYFPCPLQYFFLWLYMTVYALTNVKRYGFTVERARLWSQTDHIWIPALPLKVWSTDQQLPHHLGAC